MNICEMFDISGGSRKSSRRVGDVTTMHENMVRPLDRKGNRLITQDYWVPAIPHAA